MPFPPSVFDGYALCVFIKLVDLSRNEITARQRKCGPNFCWCERRLRRRMAPKLFSPRLRPQGIPDHCRQTASLDPR